MKEEELVMNLFLIAIIITMAIVELFKKNKREVILDNCKGSN